MSHLWISENDHSWQPLRLPVADGERQRIADVRIERTGEGLAERWMLFAAPGAVRVNGLPVRLGLRVLADRDEIVSGGRRLFFSTESLPVIEPFAGAAAVVCPRCRQPVQPGAASIRCPKCGVVHHQTEDLPCFRYGETCAMCDQPSDSESFQWSPENL